MNETSITDCRYKYIKIKKKEKQKMVLKLLKHAEDKKNYTYKRSDAYLIKQPRKSHL